MSKPSTPLSVIERVIRAANGAASLARIVGVSQSAPLMWKARGKIPAEYCPAIERATGVRCEDLRPDVDWQVLRGTQQAA